VQLVEGYELEPFKADLKSISRELSGRRRRIQELTKSYLISDEPTLAADAHELLNEADEVVSRGQKRIRRILQRLGMVLAGSEAGSPGQQAPAQAGGGTDGRFFFQVEIRRGP
jgi:transposase InsO family protein